MANYTSFAPSGIATRPFDPSSGVETGLRDIYAREGQNLDLQSMFTANQQRQAELDLFRGKMPNEQAKSDLEGAIAASTNPSVMADGKMAEAQKHVLETKKLEALLDGDIAAGKAKSRQEAAASRFAQQQTELGQMNQMFQILNQAGPPGSPASQGVYARLRSGMSPEVQQMLPEADSPQFREGLQAALQNTPAQLQKLQEIAATGKWHTDVATIGANAHRYAADAAAASRENQHAITDAKRKAAVFQAIGSGEHTPGMLEEATRYLMQEIGQQPQIKQLSQMLMMDAMENGGKNQQRGQQMLNQTAEKLWDQMAPGELKAKNPFKTPAGTKTIEHGGQTYNVLGRNPDGSIKIQDPKTGRTGTLQQ